MHHTSVSFLDGTTFLIGGRQSPYFMCSQMLKITLKVNAQHKHFSEADLQSQNVNSHLLCAKLNDTEKSARPIVHENSNTFNLESTLLDVCESTALASETESYQDRDHTKDPNDINLIKIDCDHAVCTECSTVCSGDDVGVLNSSLNHKSNSHTVLSCTFDLGHMDISVVHQRGNLPKERWRHAAVVVIIDGK